MHRRLAIVFSAVFIGAGCVATGVAPAAAGVSTAAQARSGQTLTVKKVGLAGYHFRVSGRAVLKVHGTIKVPSSTCGRKTRRYSLQIGTGFSSGGQPVDAIVLLQLRCRGGTQRSGSAELVAGYHALIPPRPVRAGQTLRIRTTVKATWSGATVVYPSGASYSVYGPGGHPTGAAYALTLSGPRPAHYTPVKFTRCTVNKRRLSAFHPGIWESVTSSGKVDGSVSALSNGTAFTITF